MMLPFNEQELSDAVERGEVTARRHPSLPYTIYNYSPSVQYENNWNDVTLNCRGLILDDDFNIVARPWRKFFNLGQVDLPIQFDDPVEVMDKADGSLGILYPDKPGIYSHSIATRGSFESTQAQRATMMWKLRYSQYDKAASISGMTYLFEIIFPENRIVLDYGNMSDLILLGAVQKSTGYYYGPREAQAFLDWTGPVVEVMPYKSISEALGHMDRANAEGYVIRSHNFMVKCKQPDYLEIHKLVTNATPKTIWEQLRAGKSKSEIVSVFPDEFHDYIESMIDPLLEAYSQRTAEILDGYHNACESVMKSERPEDWEDGDLPTRRAFARVFTASQDARYFFLLLDDKPIREILWTELKPKEAAVDKISEATAL